MFECSDCHYKGRLFHAEVANFEHGTYTYRAKCPKCGSSKVEPVAPIEERNLRLWTWNEPIHIVSNISVVI